MAGLAWIISRRRFPAAVSGQDSAYTVPSAGPQLYKSAILERVSGSTLLTSSTRNASP